MKIIEIINEGVMDVAKGFAKGANEFIAGAGGPDIKHEIGKYIKTPKGTTRSINANLPPQEQFDKVLNAIYGNAAKGQLKQDWADAINSGDKEKVKTLGQNATYRELRRAEGLDGDKFKLSHTTVIDDLIRMAKSGDIKFSVDNKKDQEEKL